MPDESTGATADDADRVAPEVTNATSVPRGAGREFAPPKPSKEFAAPSPEDVAPTWTRWVMFAVALALSVIGGIICIAAVYANGASFGAGGWEAVYDVAQGARLLSLLLLTAATFLVFGAMVGTIGVVLGPRINRLGGLAVVVVSGWLIVSASLAYVRWRDQHPSPTRRPSPHAVSSTAGATGRASG